MNHRKAALRAPDSRPRHTSQRTAEGERHVMDPMAAVTRRRGYRGRRGGGAGRAGHGTKRRGLMARTHARILTSVWEDEDFLALSGAAQRCYMMLLTQPNLGHSGLLPTTVRRWTLLCTGESETTLRAALTELESARFVVTDERTEELLVRSLIRNDGVWKQPKILAVAIAEAASIRSAGLRACVAGELARIDTSELSDKTRPEVEALLKALPGRLANARPEAPPQAPTDPPSHDPSHGAGEHPHDPPAHGDTQGAYARAHAAPTPTPTPAPAPAPAPGPSAPGGPLALLPAPETPLTETQRSKRLADAYAEAEPMCKWPAVNGVVLKAIKSGRYADDEIRDALLRLAAEGRGVTVETLRTELQGFPPRQQAGDRRQQATDDMFDRAMERAERRENVS